MDEWIKLIRYAVNANTIKSFKQKLDVLTDGEGVGE